jgi:glycosyltransferase involved in cell wall biosynthesis
VPHPVAAPAAASEPTPADPTKPFRVLSIFNFGSSYERKNPDAAVEAFRAAFAGEADAELILKVSDGARYPVERERLLARIADLPNVRLIDGVWDAARMRALLGSADAYLSLHRSEGFGLTLAEAILAGVPVVATDWSGNTDFCRPDLCYPVEYALTAFRDAHLAYAGMGPARWAEPDTAHAAQQLRRVRAEGASARAKARSLGEVLREHLNRNGYAQALAALEEAGRPTSSARAA